MDVQQSALAGRQVATITDIALPVVVGGHRFIAAVQQAGNGWEVASPPLKYIQAFTFSIGYAVRLQ